MIDKKFLRILFERLDNPDQHYRAQVIKRDKDDPGLGHTQVLKRFTFSNMQDFEKREQSIIELCDNMNARFYINPTSKSFRTIALETLKELASNISNDQYKKAKRIYDSVADRNSGIKEKRLWLIDLDKLEDDYDIKAIELYCKEKDVYVYTLPTKNGHHVIIKPFDIQNSALRTFDIKKNHNTLLYWKR